MLFILYFLSISKDAISKTLHKFILVVQHSTISDPCSNHESYYICSWDFCFNQKCYSLSHFIRLRVVNQVLWLQFSQTSPKVCLTFTTLGLFRLFSWLICRLYFTIKKLLSEISPDNRCFNISRKAQLAKELGTPEPKVALFPHENLVPSLYNPRNPREWMAHGSKFGRQLASLLPFST